MVVKTFTQSELRALKRRVENESPPPMLEELLTLTDKPHEPGVKLGILSVGNIDISVRLVQDALVELLFLKDGKQVVLNGISDDNRLAFPDSLNEFLDILIQCCSHPMNKTSSSRTI